MKLTETFNGKRLGLNPFLKGFRTMERKTVSVISTEKNRGLVASLSPSAKSLFLWIVFSLEEGEDFVYLDMEVYLESCGLKSVTTFRQGIRDLVEAGILARTRVKGGVFWVNKRIVYTDKKSNE